MIAADSESGRCGRCLVNIRIGLDEPAGRRPPARSSRLRSFVKDNCCNFFADRCAVADEQGCVVMAGGRCGWFETSVLPDATRQKGATRLLDDIQNNYAIGRAPRSVTSARENVRPCPDCGQPLAARRRVCEPCATLRRRTAYREAKRRSRCPQLTEITPQNHREKQHVFERASGGAVGGVGNPEARAERRP